MVVLAASVVSKAGKPLISRQFHPSLSRSRLESLLVSFVKLIPVGVQHTTLLSADGSMRFVYMPVDDLYVILLTPPLSNIILDIDTLQLIARIVSETCSAVGGRGAANETEVVRNSFELLSSFDEVISLGYREKVGIGEVRAAMEMESHEERIQEIIARNKEHEAKEELKRRAKQLEMQRKDMLRRGQNPYSNNSNMSTYDRPAYTPTPPVQNLGDSYGASTPSTTTAKPFKTRGMQLGSKASKQNDLIDSLGGEVADTPRPSFFADQEAPAPAPPAPVAAPVEESPFDPVDQELVHCVIREKLSLELNKEGGINSMELKGDLDLLISDAEVAKVALQLVHSDQFGNDLQFKTHPNVDKKSWVEDKVLALKDPKRGFPVGQVLKVVRWRMASKDESFVPLSINCWPSPTDQGTCDVSLEYELEAENTTFRNVLISIPLPLGAYPTITNSVGSYSINPETHTLDWTIDSISSVSGEDDTKSGSLEFSVQGDDTAAFFPIAVDFVSQDAMCGVKVVGVKAAGSGEQVTFSEETVLSSEKYLVA